MHRFVTNRYLAYTWFMWIDMNHYIENIVVGHHPVMRIDRNIVPGNNRQFARNLNMHIHQNESCTGSMRFTTIYPTSLMGFTVRGIKQMITPAHVNNIIMPLALYYLTFMEALR